MNGLTTHHLEGVTVLRFDRAEKKNALTPEMLTALGERLQQLRTVPPRAFVLSGHGESFCAGFDLSLCRDDDTALSSLLQNLSFCVRAMRALPCPVVVSAHGAAIAGGCALLGGSDFALTTHTAKLGYPVLTLGISPAVSAPFLRAAVGEGQARNRLLDTALISGDHAVRIGLCHSAHADAATCEQQAIVLAQHLASKPPHAIAATREWLNTVDDSLSAAHADHALNASLSLANSPEQSSRLAAMWQAQSRK
jgi:methylglutaconyl-CoA hydratase